MEPEGSSFFMSTDEVYMARYIELALKAEGETYPNPLVGSVIVHDNKIIGEGYHHEAGEAHAEINAINSVADFSLLRESTIYVSLEPCSHYGRTPPCALKLKEIGFKRVVIGTLDPHAKVNGRGKKILEDAGLIVDSSVLEAECRRLNKRFFTFHQKKRPYIILKWAETADGFIDCDFRPLQIGNTLTKQFVHTLRAQENAILVGTKTVLHDNPRLTTREVSGRNPVRIVIDFDLKIPLNYKIFDDQARTIVFNSVRSEVAGNIHYIKVNRQDFPKNCMSILFDLQIQSVLVEGGAATLQQFIDRHLWDEALVIRNPVLTAVNGTRAPGINIECYQTKHFRDNRIEFYKNADNSFL